MDKEQMLAEIREANLTYLMLAQRLISHDRVEAIYRLGISEETADILGALSSAQVLKIASGNMLLCHMRVTDEIVWQLLTTKIPRACTPRFSWPGIMPRPFEPGRAHNHERQKYP